MEVLNEAMELYSDEENHKVTVAAAIVETDCFCFHYVENGIEKNWQTYQRLVNGENP